MWGRGSEINREAYLVPLLSQRVVVSLSAMPSMTAHQFSLLTRQLAFGAEAFARRYPNCWLLWEAGGTHGHLSDVSLSVVETAVAGTRKNSPHPAGDDSLCFVLKPSEGESLRVGRALDNEVVIAEPTVSRVHARLELEGTEWHLLPLSEKRRTLVGGKVAFPGESVKLSSGVAVELGGVKLSFYDAKAFKALVARVPLRASR